MTVPQLYVICLLSVVGAVFCAWQVRQALREPNERDQIVAAARRRGRLLRGTQHDIGPDALRLLEELDAHLDEHVAADPELAAGFDRLRDEQQKGETA